MQCICIGLCLHRFFILSLKTIPSVLLEKDIKIYKVVVVQALEGTVFYLIIIAMVFMNFDIQSLVVAVLARAVIGTTLIYILNPWLPTLSFSWSAAKRLLRYGVPFQGNSFLAFFKDDLLILYLGGAIGLTNLGYVTFAKKYAEFSIRLIMDNINRVAFPLFARFQADSTLLKKSLEKVLYYETISIFAITIGAMLVFDVLLQVIPGGYYDKWHLSLTSFYFFSLSALFVSLYSPLINLFNAVGKVNKSLLFMLYFTVLTWVLIPPMIVLFGYQGISYAFFIMSLSFFLVLKEAIKIVRFSMRSVLRDVFVALTAMIAVIVFLRLVLLDTLEQSFAYLVAAIVCGGGVYIANSWYKIKGRALYGEVVDLFKKYKTHMSSIAVITVNYKNYSDTEELIASFSKQTNKNYHIYVVDVSPQPESLPDYKQVTRINAENRGYAFGLNTGYRLAEQDGYKKYVFINNDVLVAQDFVASATTSIATHPSKPYRRQNIICKRV
ncbi:MAG: Lipopolysaccharide biosynthesis protein WzxC [Microgenomates bacterium OLB23]|nr:MAG: Lipopolysaccharide biosynthesis protein WzxC [Microgenomates bacterium OLB23]